MKKETVVFKGKNSFSGRLEKIIGSQSVKAFARASGVDDKSIRKYLAGTSEPTLKNLLKLSAAGDVSVQWLATGERAESKTVDTEDRGIQKTLEILEQLPEQDRKEILSRAKNLYKVHQQAEELAALKEMVLKLANDS